MRVKNKAVVRRLTWRGMKATRGRNLIAVLAIALTATLFTAIFSVGGNMLQAMETATMRQVGSSAHGGLKYLSQAQYDNVSQSPLIQDISYDIIVGFAENQELVKKQHEIRYAEDQMARWGFSYPTVGDMPRERGQLACSTLTLDLLGLPYELGVEVPLEFTVKGKTYHETYTLCGYWPGDDVMMAAQIYLSREDVDGIITVPQERVDRGEPNYIQGTIAVGIWFSSASNIEANMETLLAERGYAEDELSMGVNWAYLGGGNLDMQTMLLLGFLLAVVLLSGYLIIYSIFSISVTGDIRFYGLLKTIGTTGKQLRSIIRGQALLLSVAGIPLGLLLGWLLGWQLTPLLFRMTTYRMVNFTPALNPWIFLFSIIFSLVTIFISCWKPARMAARVSPVEALRFTDAKVSKKQQGKARRVSPFTMAWANIRRSWKKLVVVVLSLSMSLVLLNSIYTVVKGFDIDTFMEGMIVSDFSVAHSSMYTTLVNERDLEGVDEAFQSQLAALPGLEEQGSIYLFDGWHQLSPGVLDKAKELFRIVRPMFAQRWPGSEQELDHNAQEGGLRAQVFGAGDMALEVLLAGMDEQLANQLKSGDYILAVSNQDDERKVALPQIYDTGDLVTLDNGAGETRDYTVLAVIPEYSRPLSPGYSYLIDCQLILPEAAYLSLYGDRQPMMSIFNVAEEYVDQTEDFLENYCSQTDPTLNYRSKGYFEDEFAGLQHMFLVCGGALAAILALIGLLNFVNTSVTSILARKRELAMLQSVGMTSKQLKTMLFGEGILYAATAFAFSAVLACLLSVVLIQVMGGQLWFFTWSFTFWPMILCLIPMLLICAAVPLICNHFMQKEPMVERLRME